MARKLSAPSTLYPAGTYTRTVDGFNANTTSKLEWTATVEGWPTTPDTLLATVTVSWEGGGGRSIIPFRTNPMGRDRLPATVMSGYLYPPLENDGESGQRKRAIAAATFTMEVFVPFRTTLSIEAIA